MSSKTHIIPVKENYLNNKKKIPGIIFTRAFCCLGIVIFHYFLRSRGKFKFMVRTANSDFGVIFVTTFFCISGAVLYYNYPKVKSIKVFYFKRWKSIFPSFYICYIYFFLRNILRNHMPFDRLNWSKILLTLIGLDGYLIYKIKTFYLVGEWFLGAIIIIYSLYPLLLLAINYDMLIKLSICIFYVLIYKKIFFTIANDRNIITCLISFYFGIISIKFQKIFFENKITLIIAFLIFILLYKIRISSFILIFQIQGFSLFILLVSLGKYIMSKKLKIIFIDINNISYCIFLYHHQIMFDVLNINNHEEWYYHLLSLFIIFLLTYICSKIHIIVLNSVIKSNLFQKLESFLFE